MAYRYDRRVVFARDVNIDLGLIEGLRKDFLTLMKNLPRVRNYKDGDKLREAFKVFSLNFKELFFETFLNRDFKYDRDVDDSTRHWYDQKLRKSGWSFYIELRLPLGYPDDYYSEEGRFAAYEREKDKWANRVKDKARDFWKDMKDFFDHRERVKGSPSYTVKTRDEELVELEGFKVLVVGFDEDGEGFMDEYRRDFLERFKEGLRHFRRRASEVFPDMLRHMLPIHLNAYATLDEGGRYEGNHIEVAMSGFFEHKNPNIVAHVLAHEMGHHLFKTFLSEQDRKFWYETVREDYEKLDLVKLLEIWPKDITYASDLVEKLKDSDPHLALQLDVASYGAPLGGADKLDKREDAEKLVAEGRHVFAPKHPITGYSGKNHEEAFCEAIGHIVGYGPNTVPEIVRHWLHMILPGIRVASRQYVQASMRKRLV